MMPSAQKKQKQKQKQKQNAGPDGYACKKFNR